MLLSPLCLPLVLVFFLAYKIQEDSSHAFNFLRKALELSIPILARQAPRLRLSFTQGPSAVGPQVTRAEALCPISWSTPQTRERRETEKIRSSLPEQDQEGWVTASLPGEVSDPRKTGHSVSVRNTQNHFSKLAAVKE